METCAGEHNVRVHDTLCVRMCVCVSAHPCVRSRSELMDREIAETHDAIAQAVVGRCSHCPPLMLRLSS